MSSAGINLHHTLKQVLRAPLRAWRLAMTNVKLPRRKFLHLAAGIAALPAVSRMAWAQA
jgi:hypothetical protein